MNNTDTTSLLSKLYSVDQQEILNSLVEINETIQITWAEVSEELPKLVELCESFVNNLQLANLVTSKAYFYIGSYEKAVQHALEAGELFDFHCNSDYNNKIISTLVEVYITTRKENKVVPEKYELVMNKFFDEALEQQECYIALGVAMEAKRIDIIERALNCSSEKNAIIEYIKKILNETDVEYDFKTQILKILTEIVLASGQIDVQSISEFWVKKNDVDGFIQMLERLPEEIKMQVLLDYEGISQKFRSELIKKLPELYHPYIDGKIQEKLYLNFLFSMEKTDNLLLNNIKAANCIKNSVIQTCVLYANAYMHYGTTNVMFLKDNNEWIINSSNWAKYATTASLGVLYKGHENEALRLMSPYTKTGTGGKSVYAQSGRLYALGLIFSGHGQEVLPDMLEDLKHSKTTGSEVVQHGACLGIGLAGVGSEDMEIFHEVKDILISSNSAVAGMTAGMAMGLVMMGTGDIEVCAEMINQCHNTKHSKIIRGTGVGISLIMFGMQQKADIVIGQMINDADAVVRYGGMFTIAMAYCGTANEDAIKQLLHYSVTDSSDEVKEQQFFVWGFVLSKELMNYVKTIHLLIDSYNPHIRFGSALALGIAGASSNNPHVIKLLEPLLKDPTDFVKQGAYMAMGMVYMEASVKESPNITKFVDGLQEKIMSKSEGMLTQFGCILGLGVLNAGGRNCCITMTNVLGTFNMKAIAGLVLFSQYWYWYPFTLTLSLAFTPTTIIGVTPDLKVAKTFQYCSNAPTSTFDYLPMTKPKTKTGPAKMNQTTLSYTKKALGTSTNLSSSLLVTDKMKEELIPEEKVMEEVVEEQPFVILENGSRVTQRQMQFIQEVDGNRYVPVKKFTRGIMILRDTQPQMEEDNDGILKEAANETEMTDDHKMLTEALLTQNAEPAPPEPFEWKFN